MLLSFFVVPWWAVLALLLVYTAYFSPAYESIALGFFADTLYNTGPIYTLSITVALCVSYFVLSRLRL